MIEARMLTKWLKRFRVSDSRGIDGNKPRDAYLDVLKAIQSPQPARGTRSSSEPRIVRPDRTGAERGVSSE